jgi:hypothetical protein
MIGGSKNPIEKSLKPIPPTMFNNIEFHLSILQIEFYSERTKIRLIDFDFWSFNANFNNISVISWRPVLALEYPENFLFFI